MYSNFCHVLKNFSKKLGEKSQQVNRSTSQQVNKCVGEGLVRGFRIFEISPRCLGASLPCCLVASLTFLKKIVGVVGLLYLCELIAVICAHMF